MQLRELLERARTNLSPGVLGQLVQAAVAAAISWELALLLPGSSGQPFFAPIAAAIALNAERGRRGRQAVEMMTGVSAGIVIGASAVAVGGSGVWQILAVTFAAFLLTTAAGAPRIVRGQAASSAILVVALYGPTSNLTFQRLEDALIGGAVAIVIARFLLPVDPIPLVRDEARNLRAQLAGALDDAASALAAHDRERAEAAVERIWSIDDSALARSLITAREVTRAAPRRRPLRRRVEKLGELYRELEASVYDSHAIATGVVRLAGSDGPPPREAVAAVEAAAAAVREIEPDSARAAAARTRDAAGRLREADPSLGAAVMAHGAVGVADHTLRAAQAREAERRLAVTHRFGAPLTSRMAATETTSNGFIREAVHNRRILGVALIAAVGGFLFGYDTGVIGGAMLFMQKDLGLNTAGEQEMTVAILLLGAVAGAAISGWAADRFSRRRVKITSGCVYVIGALGCAFSQTYPQILASRFWLGLAVGTASFVAPMYIAELVPPRIRGGVVSFNQLMITLGILVAYIVDWGFAGFSNNWRWMFGVGVIPGAVLAIGMFFMPFSPRWLVEKGRKDEARRVLGRYRDSDEDVEDEVHEIEEIAETEFSMRELLGKAVRRMMIVGVALAIFQQIVGINTVIYYAPTILKFAGQQNTGALTQSVFIGCTNVFFTIVAILLLDRLGRRFFLITGTSILTVALIGLGIFFAMSGANPSAAAGGFALACLLVYIAGFAIGLGPVFWLMIAEIFPLQMRGPAMAVCTMFNWGFNFLIAYTFLSLTTVITKQGTFWLYAFFGICAVIFFVAVVPETKDRSLEEIQADLGADADTALTREREPETARA
ncbi:MAG TPA: sugar porter family MFS transporter [Gaiellaceae bacterium]|nr:sugar porter family MFS transporter [Gaiellaceae bacterium]